MVGWVVLEELVDVNELGGAERMGGAGYLSE